MSALRKAVLHNFKKLHRTRLRVFDGDERALIAARTKINEEFNKSKHVKDEDAIRAMIQFSEDVERELKSQVIQAREVKPGVFEAKITNDTLKIDNIPYNDSAIPEEAVPGQKPCHDQAKNTQL
ncbi:complex III assembly factor LYRM7 [Maniola hyperantus]|uniref:complex III assembly factor LYRM7 n=1 Tax=Aphantopus hyperantus TaxID=2795564 RepID=UPI001567F836|nr:complex III assembly factor LYRM7 [Maniola hyperantus]